MAAMDAPVITEAMDWLVRQLLAGSLQGGLAVALVWFVCRRFEAIPAWARATLWWLATLKLLLALAPIPSIPLPLLPAPAAAHIDEPQVQLPIAVEDLTVVLPAPVTETEPIAEPIAGAATGVAIAAAVWLLIVIAQAARLARAHGRLRGVVSRAEPLTGDEWPIGRIARDIGLRFVPELRQSHEIGAPQVVGIWRPVILLPAMVQSLTPGQRAMTVCHELMHVRRRDLLLGWVPAFAERLFFFHPLARLAAREYLVAREAACDAAVLQALDVEPQEYGRLLVSLGITNSEPGLSAAGSATSSSCLARRLAMLDRTSLSGVRPRLAWLALAALALAVLPLSLVARTSDATRLEPAIPLDAMASTLNLGQRLSVARGAAARQFTAPDDLLRDLESLKLELRQLEDGTIEGHVEAELKRQSIKGELATDLTSLREMARALEGRARAGEQAARPEERARAEQQSQATISELQRRLEELALAEQQARAVRQQDAEARQTAELAAARQAAEVEAQAARRQIEAAREAMLQAQVEQVAEDRQLERLLVRERVAAARDLELAQSLTEAHPDRVLNRKVLEDLRQEIRAYAERLKRLGSNSQAQTNMLRELERSVRKQQEAIAVTPDASLSSLNLQMERLMQYQRELERQRAVLSEQQRRLAEYEKSIAAEVEKMYELLKLLQSERK